MEGKSPFEVNMANLRLSQDDDIPDPGDSIIERWKTSGLIPEKATNKQKIKSYNQFLKMMFLRSLTVNMPKSGNTKGVKVLWVPGHKLYNEKYPEEGLYYPEQADVMVIGKCLGDEEFRDRMHWIGDGGKELRRCFVQNGIDPEGIYGTNVLKFSPPYKISSIPAAWLREVRFFLEQEIRLVKPKFILLLGADALKALYGNKATLSKYKGAVLDYNGAKVMVANNPAHIMRKPELLPGFRASITMFADLVHGKEHFVADTKYEVIKNEQRLSEVVDYLLEKGVTEFAVDAEWTGEKYVNQDAHLLTIQFSYKVGHAYVVVLRSDVSDFDFKPSRSRAIYQLRRLFCRDEVAIAGHNFRADIQWFIDSGLDVRKQYVNNGFDTIMADHILEENAEHALEHCVLRYTDMGRYDLELSELLSEGYIHGTVPDEKLWKYGAGDADATFRLWQVYKDLLWKAHKLWVEEYNEREDDNKTPEETDLRGKGFDPNKWYPSLWNLYYELVMKVCQPIIEMEMTGVLTDKDRLIEMIKSFVVKRDEIVEIIRDTVHNPDFNPRSYQQVALLLYSPPNYEDKKGVMREGLCLKPVKTTGKPSKLWDELVEVGEATWSDEEGWVCERYSPSTDAETLGILADKHPVAGMLRDYKFIDQIIKTFLREPEEDPNTGEIKYSSGLLGYSGPDSRIRTTISQLTETGRYRSSRPNMQNLPKAREGDLSRIFSTGRSIKVPPIRSAFYAPDGWVIIEADFESAELYTLAYCANDKVMKEDLEQVDPETGKKLSLHSITAVSLFDLNMPVPEFDARRKHESLEGYRLSGFRVAAKSVNFGIPYQRGGAAIAREAQREGVECTEEDGQQWVRAWYDRYRGNAKFIQACKDAVEDPGYVRTNYGRMRRFYPSKIRAVMAAQQREACNFPIQSVVAESLSLAEINIQEERDKLGLRSRMMLPVHDAVLMQAPYEEVPIVTDMLQRCMCDMVEVPGTGLHYGIDVGVFVRWGEKLTDPVILEKCGLEAD